MNTECDVIRDLLPLYADDVCSAKSREIVEAHLAACPACSALLQAMRSDEAEAKLLDDKRDAIRYGEKRLKRRSAAVGAVLSGLFMIPILVCLIVNITSGQGLGWFFIVLASLAVAASLIIVPLMAPEDKLLWTFVSFCGSLMVLLAVVCICTHGTWFWIASSATLFGLSVLFLPFAVRAKPVQRLLGNADRRVIVLGVDAALFVHMMNMIFSHNRFSFGTVILLLGTLAGVGLIAIEIIRKRGTK